MNVDPFWCRKGGRRSIGTQKPTDSEKVKSQFQILKIKNQPCGCLERQLTSEDNASLTLRQEITAGARKVSHQFYHLSQLFTARSANRPMKKQEKTKSGAFLFRRMNGAKTCEGVKRRRRDELATQCFFCLWPDVSSRKSEARSR